MHDKQQRGIVGVVLAGGLSRRMGGGDKGLLPLGSATMLDEVIRRLEPQVDSLVINANGEPARFARFGLAVAADPIDGFVGPLAGVLAGMRWSASKAPKARWIVTAPGDAPLLPRDLVDGGGVIPRVGHRPGDPVPHRVHVDDQPLGPRPVDLVPDQLQPQAHVGSSFWLLSSVPCNRGG